ncbi:MAG: DUF362 domain-containing protein [Polyangiaceae bacterium]
MSEDSKPSRRRVIKWGGALVGATAIGGGTYVLKELRDRGYILRTPNGPPQPMPDHRVEFAATLPRFVIARGKDAAKNTLAALERMGGMKRFVAKGDRVVVKPNIGFDLGEHYAVTTSPVVVATVVRECLAAGAREVIVSDGPVKNLDAAFDKSGIRRAAREAGATVVTPAERDFVNTTLPGWGTWPVLEPYVQADKIINVPIVKHHGLAGTTIGMKAWFGAIGGMRPKLHKRIDEAVAGLAEMMRPTLTVVDATRALMRNGPGGGNLDDVRSFDTVAVSVDPVAIDAWASTLIKPRRKLGWLDLAQARGLGTRDFKSLSPVELSV